MQTQGNRLRILDLHVDQVDMERAVAQVEEMLHGADRPHSIFAVNPEKNFSIPKDSIVRDVFESADLLIPDGISIVLSARLLHGAKFSRVPGVDLMHRICEMAARLKLGVFMYGAREEVNRKASEQLKTLYPGLDIVGRSHGYVKEESMGDLIDRINLSGAEILFLALGSPKQERWYAAHCKELYNIKICQGIGGTLDTIAGNVARAPRIWQRFYVEWLYRLLQDPKRIKRQKVLPLFALRVLARKLHTVIGGH